MATKYLGLITIVSFSIISLDAQVGIGTSDPATSLHVVDDSTATEIRIEHPSQSVLTLQAGSPVLRWSDGINIKARAQWVNNQLKLFSSPPEGFPISFSYPTLNLSEDRKVGINLGLLSSPTESLEVNGRVKLGFSSDPGTAGTLRYNPATQSFEGCDGNNWWGLTSTLKDTDGDSYIQLIENNRDEMRFTLNATESMVFNGFKLDLGKNGNLIIGAQSTQHDLASNANNTIIGTLAGYDLQSGISNTFIGNYSGFSMVGGDFNTLVGDGSGYKNNGFRNTILGYHAGYNNTGNDNVLIGHEVGMDWTGDSRLMIGNQNTNTPLIDGYFGLQMLTINGTLDVAQDIVGLQDGIFTGQIEAGSGRINGNMVTQSLDIDNYQFISANNMLTVKQLGGQDLLKITSGGELFLPALAGNGVQDLKVLNTGEVVTNHKTTERMISPYEFTPNFLHLNDILDEMQIDNITDLTLWHLPNANHSSLTLYRVKKDPYELFQEPIFYLSIPTNNTTVVQTYSTNVIITSGSEVLDTETYFYYLDSTNHTYTYSAVKIEGN